MAVKVTESGVRPLDPTRIGYCDEPVHHYVAALGKAETLAELKAVGRRYELLFPDAGAVIAAMDAKEFPDFRKGLRSERRGKFAGEEWVTKYGAVVMPEIGIQVGIIASRMHVQFGLVFNRMRDEGYITIENGCAVYRRPTAPSPQSTDTPTSAT